MARSRRRPLLLVTALLAGFAAMFVVRELRDDPIRTPRQTDADATLDFAYGEHPRQRYDVFVPDGDGPFPAIVWIHGGGWLVGDKTESMPVWDWTDRGYVVIAVNYRFADGEHTIADATADTITAIEQVLAAADTHRIDSTRVGVYGFSAGGHLAGMVQAADLGVAAVAVGGAPTDFEPLVDPARSVFELRPSSEAAAVIRERLGCDDDCGDEIATLSPARVAPGSAPVLIVHGTADGFVDVSQARAYAAHLEASNVRHRLVIVDGGGHGFPDAGAVEAFFDAELA